MENYEKNLMAGVEKLWNDGHAEELIYWGLRCAKNYNEGYLKGARKGLIEGCLQGAAVGLGLALVGAFVSYEIQKHKSQKSEEEG